MNNLTEEQRHRMESNRRKALEKRAAAASSCGNVPPTAAYPVVPSLFHSSSSAVPQTQLQQQDSLAKTMQMQQSQGGRLQAPSSTSTSANNSHPYLKPDFKFATKGAAQPLQPANKPIQVQQSQPVLPFRGKPVGGTCVIISKDRFIVDMKYQPQAIAIFKSIKGCMYDQQAKTWSFPLSEHSNLLAALQPLKPAVTVGSIPTNVLKILLKTKTTYPDRVVAENDLAKIDPVLNGLLMPFQKDGVNFGINHNGRVLIADDMGLGKTIQALGIAHYYYSEWPLLIVAPSSVRFAWRDSIWNWLPSVPAGAIIVIETSKDDFDSAKVVIVSYDLLQKRSEELSRFRVVIFDESHNLKNPKAARTRAAIPIIQKSKRAILLSGTPALSRPIELFTQISSIAYGTTLPFLNYYDFGIRYCNGKKAAYGMDYSGSSNMFELQLILEETIMIRRLKSDVLKQLPPKLRKLVVLDPSLIKLTGSGLRTSAKAFDVANKMGPKDARGKLLEYYHETAKTKLKAVSAYIKDLVENGKKFICFAHHRSLLDGISETLEEIECRYIRIDGSTMPEERQELVEQFQSCDDILVAVLSITAANSGITLTAAGLVVFAELYWNPGILTQAEDRAHRIGQQDSVVVEYLLAQGTADDVIWPKVKEKLAVLNQAGLSKDNFHEAGTSCAFMAPVQSKQKGISEFFQPLSASQEQTSTSIAPKSFTSANSMTDELAALEADQDLLLQLLEESFSEANSK